MQGWYRFITIFLYNIFSLPASITFFSKLSSLCQKHHMKLKTEQCSISNFIWCFLHNEVAHTDEHSISCVFIGSSIFCDQMIFTFYHVCLYMQLISPMYPVIIFLILHCNDITMTFHAILFFFKWRDRGFFASKRLSIVRNISKFLSHCTVKLDYREVIGTSKFTDIISL